MSEPADDPRPDATSGIGPHELRELELLHFKRRLPTLQDHIDHGRLLGYSADEIAAFVERVRLK